LQLSRDVRAVIASRYGVMRNRMAQPRLKERSITTMPAAGTRVVALSQLVCDKRALPREALDAARVDEFASLYRDELPAGIDPFPPIGCVEDRDGRLVLFDGWHRAEARRRIAAEYPDRGYDELPASAVRAGSRDAVDYAYELAIECSAIGAKQLTQRERIAAAKRLSEIRPDLSAREIANRLGITHPTVLRARGSTATTGGGTRVPRADQANSSADNDSAPRSRSSSPRRVTLEQRAWHAANALSDLFAQAAQESRGMLGLGKPNLARAGAATYRALERSYGEQAPGLVDDLLVLATAMRDAAAKVA
jgi:hypothetical protein